MELAEHERTFSKRFDQAVKEFFELLSLCMDEKTFFVSRTTPSTFSVLKVSEGGPIAREGLTLDLQDSL